MTVWEVRDANKTGNRIRFNHHSGAWVSFSHTEGEGLQCSISRQDGTVDAQASIPADIVGHGFSVEKPAISVTNAARGNYVALEIAHPNSDSTCKIELVSGDDGISVSGYFYDDPEAEGVEVLQMWSDWGDLEATTDVQTPGYMVIQPAVDDGVPEGYVLWGLNNTDSLTDPETFTAYVADDEVLGLLSLAGAAAEMAEKSAKAGLRFENVLLNSTKSYFEFSEEYSADVASLSPYYVQFELTGNAVKMSVYDKHSGTDASFGFEMSINALRAHSAKRNPVEGFRTADEKNLTFRRLLDQIKEGIVFSSDVMDVTFSGGESAHSVNRIEGSIPFYYIIDGADNNSDLSRKGVVNYQIDTESGKILDVTVRDSNGNDIGEFSLEDHSKSMRP